MVKTALTEGFDTSRLIISTTTVAEGEGYRCTGRIVQGRGVVQENGEIDWEDKTIDTEVTGENHSTIEGLALEQLFSYLVSQDFYLFEEEDDGSEDDIQEV